MKTIALIAQKVGVGKTTLAINLAVAGGVRTAIFDLDQQESAAIWADRRKNDQPHVEFLTERRLSDGLRGARFRMECLRRQALAWEWIAFACCSLIPTRFAT